MDGTASPRAHAVPGDRHRRRGTRQLLGSFRQLSLGRHFLTSPWASAAFCRSKVREPLNHLG